MSTSLPKGWIETRLGDVTHVSKEKVEPGNMSGLRYLSLEHIQSETREILGWGDSNAVKSTKNVFRSGDVLYGKLRPYLNKVCRPIFDGVCSTDILVFPESTVLLNDLLLYLLSSKEVVAYTSLRQKGVNLPRIGASDLQPFRVGLPPHSEQRRIANKITTLDTHSRAARKHLDAIPPLLEQFRASVLSAACSGKLTAEWRLANNAAEWEQITLGTMAELVTSGSRGWAEYYADSGATFIRAQNLKPDRLDLSDVAHVRLPAKGEGLRTLVSVHDILVTITGANVTKTAIVSHDVGEAYVSQHVALVRLRLREYAPYVWLWLISPAHGRSQLLDVAYGGGKPGLNLTQIRDVRVAIPSLPEQHEIVRRVRTLFAFADAVEKKVAVAAAHEDDLTRSILAKAFRGELVPQDPNDEPATELLKRITEEKEKMQAAKKETPRKGGGRSK